MIIWHKRILSGPSLGYEISFGRLHTKIGGMAAENNCYLSYYIIMPYYHITLFYTILSYHIIILYNYLSYLREA